MGPMDCGPRTDGAEQLEWSLACVQQVGLEPLAQASVSTAGRWLRGVTRPRSRRYPVAMPTRPWVLVNMAVSADGKVDDVVRRGARISGPHDSARVDRLRAESDAVMVGGHTLLTEDPRLSVRDPGLVETRRKAGRSAQPAKVAVVSRIDAPGGPDALPPDSRFLVDGGGRVLVHTTTRSSTAAVAWLEERSAVVSVHEGPRVDLPALLDDLVDDGIARLLVEGGGTLVAALLADRLVDELQLAVSPIVLGGEGAPTPVEGPGLTRDQAIELELLDATPDGDGGMVLRYRVGGEQPR
jgi:2,5-diamino-6-(ribosylamino)-4(3H)-pyrimidinone 5'-phosphate reductase